MSKTTGNDMEEIQKNLEKFLQQEINESKSGQEERYRTPFDEEEAQEEPPEQAEYDEEDDDEEDDDDDEEEDDEDDEEDDEDDDDDEYDRLRQEEHRRRKEQAAHKRKLKKEKKKERLEKQNVKAGKMSKSDQRARQKKKGRYARGEEPRKKSGFKKFLMILLILLALFGVLWFWAVGSVYDKMDFQSVGELDREPLKDKDVTNILLIGSDSRTNEEEGRSDAMILLSISNKTNSIHMTSLLRDMYVEIPGHDGNRLNAAYSYGGAELLLETVSTNLDIEVNRYVVVNFQTFANLVDAVGGVEIELSNEEVQWVNAYLNEYNQLREMPLETDYLDTSLSGKILLNGPQALAYSRNRYIGTDFERTNRQRKVLSEVFGKLPGAVVKNPKDLLNGIFANLTTNLSKTECLRLSLMAGKLVTHEIVQSSIPLEGTYQNANIRGMAVLEVDFEANKEYIRKNIYGLKE